MVNYGKPCNEPSEGLAVAIRSKFGPAEPQFNYHCADEVSMARRTIPRPIFVSAAVKMSGPGRNCSSCCRRSNQIPFCGEHCGQLRGPCSNYSLNSIKYIMRLTDRRRRYGIPLRFSGGHSNATNSLERSQVMSTQIMRKFPHNEHKHSGQEGPGRRRGDRVLNK